ncbi:MAG: hypothetical protein VX278_08770 [Myxococcota bacterium]|nr:hypothetical protein [Myxococcota bacterium]
MFFILISILWAQNNSQTCAEQCLNLTGRHRYICIRSCEKEIRSTETSCTTQCNVFQGYRQTACESQCLKKTTLKLDIQNSCREKCKTEPSRIRYQCEQDCTSIQSRKAAIQASCQLTCGDRTNCFVPCMEKEEAKQACEARCSSSNATEQNRCKQECSTSL